MQGERDAKMRWGKVYAASLKGLHKQLSKDLGREDVNFVIGRLSDFDMKNSRYPHWTMVREEQVKVAKSSKRFSWVNTDDLNDGLNRRGKNRKRPALFGRGLQDAGQTIRRQRPQADQK